MTQNDPNPADHCQRCKRITPSDLPVEWEAVDLDDGEVGVICPGCITNEEHLEMYEADLDMIAQIEALRRGGATP
jgi:hypothetical protein